IGYLKEYVGCMNALVESGVSILHFIMHKEIGESIVYQYTKEEKTYICVYVPYNHYNKKKEKYPYHFRVQFEYLENERKIVIQDIDSNEENKGYGTLGINTLIQYAE